MATSPITSVVVSVGIAVTVVVFVVDDVTDLEDVVAVCVVVEAESEMKY